MTNYEDLEGLELSIKTLPFSGQDEDWDEWSSKALAIASKRGWREALERDLTIVREGMSDEVKVANEKANSSAFYWLVLSLKGEQFARVDSANGNAYYAWSMLKERYEGQEQMDLIELTVSFMKSRLKDVTKDPITWFLELEKFQCKINRIKAGLKSD